MSRLLDEIRRRKVGRVMLAYAATAFVVLQVADIVLPPLGAPDWVMATVVGLAALGFPIAVALAWAFDVTDGGVVRTPDAAVNTAPVTRRKFDRHAIALVGGVAALSLIAAGAYARSRYIADPTLDQNLVAVVPFRVSGDASLEYLREGMVDLFAATLTGESGPRAADPRLVMTAIERISGDAELTPDSAALVARAVDAGRVLSGSVVGTQREIVINALLVRVSGTNRTIEAVARGPADQISVLIDRITAQLLSLDAGETDQRLANLTSTSLPALRAYLAGQHAYRRSRFGDALTSFDQAVAHDSTFALAAMMLNMASGWSLRTAPNQARAPRLAMQYRHKLSPTDSTLLAARIGGTTRSRARRRSALAIGSTRSSDCRNDRTPSSCWATCCSTTVVWPIARTTWKPRRQHSTAAWTLTRRSCPR